MEIPEAECSTARSRPQASASNSSTHYLAKCVLKGSAILQVVQGRFRSPHSRDIVFGKETSIELVILGNDGVVQSFCEQTIFGTIKDLDIIPWNDKSDAQNSKLIRRDLLIVLSDSGKISFLTFCNEMNRFFPVTHIRVSNPGNSWKQKGRMLAVDSTGCYIAANAYEGRFAILSASLSAGNNIIDKKVFYPPETEVDASIRGSGTIWSLCFISSKVSNEGDPVLAILLNRRSPTIELLLFEWNIRENDLYLISTYVNEGPLALDIIEVPHLPGFAFLYRAGDLLLMDLRDAQNPCCLFKTAFVRPTYYDEVVSTAATISLLHVRDSGVIFTDIEDIFTKLSSSYICSWTWESQCDGTPRLIFSVHTGELFMVEISSESDHTVHISNCLYKGLPCKALFWIEGGLLAAIVEMGDGMIMKLDSGKLICVSPIQNLAPILDMLFADLHNENQDQLHVCCGDAPWGSLRTIRNDISVEILLKTSPVYEGITGTWPMKMKMTDQYHSFLVLSFVEETRVLTVGMSFIDMTDSVGFQPDVCTLASGLVADGLLIQIHHSAVRLCQPNKVAHSEGIPSSSPISTSWFPRDMSINTGAVGQNFVVVSTSNPSLLTILGIRLLSMYNYEIFEMHHLKLSSEISCISVPKKCVARRHSDSHVSIDNYLSTGIDLPPGVQIGTTFVIGTHKPSVEVLCLTHDDGLKIIASGTISMTNTIETATSGWIPQDVSLFLVDQLYVLSGLRNGMLLRFEWPASSWMFVDQTYLGPSISSFSEEAAEKPDKRSSQSFVPSVPHLSSSEHIKDNSPIGLQLIATRQIGRIPVVLVPLSDCLDADVILLSDRPWLLQTARHVLCYTSISFQPSTHVTPVCSAECPGGIIFVAENRLHLVEMVHSKRPNVQKLKIAGTPTKVLYHRASRLLVVMRIGLHEELCWSDVCCVDPCTGAVLSRFKLDHKEIGRSMEFFRTGNNDVLVIGTSLPYSSPDRSHRGAAEISGHLIVLCLDQMQNIDDGSTALSPKTGPSSLGSSASGEVWQLRVAYKEFWPGVVLAICPYLDCYFLTSAGNRFFICGFDNGDPTKVVRYAKGKTGSLITSLQSHRTRIAVGDCGDGILFYSFDKNSGNLELDYSDPSGRLVGDCVLADVDTAVVTDRKGTIAVLSCSDRTEDNNAFPERNLTLCCAYNLGEISVRLKKGSLSYYKLPEDTIFASTLSGSIIILVPISREEHQLLLAVQAILSVHPLTAPVLGNNHNEFRSRENLGRAPKIIDGDMVGQFLDLTSMQQESLMSLILSSPDTTVSGASHSPPPISVSQVIQLLERFRDYALN